MNGEEKQRIAAKAAKLLAEQGVLDYGWARAKAAEELGCSNGRDIPDLAQVEAAFREYQQLFRPQDRQCLTEQRAAVIETMGRFQQFSPRIVGPASRGICAPNASIRLHLFADSAKEVLFVLFDENIPYESVDVTLSPKSGVRENYPGFEIERNGVPLQLLVLPLNAIQHPPIDPVTGKAERGMTLERLSEGAPETV